MYFNVYYALVKNCTSDIFKLTLAVTAIVESLGTFGFSGVVFWIASLTTAVCPLVFSSSSPSKNSVPSYKKKKSRLGSYSQQILIHVQIVMICTNIYVYVYMWQLIRNKSLIR